MTVQKIMVVGGDGFCGWPTSLHLAKEGNEVLIVDNLSRRKIDVDLGLSTLTPIASIEDRISVANQLVGSIKFHQIDVASQFDELKSAIAEFKPDAIVHFGEQRSAPHSMISDEHRNYSVNNNIVGTHNICSAIVAIKPDIHLIHLGTMGVYGYSKEFGRIPEGYLGIKVLETAQKTEILYPANPGSIYHMTKCLDQLIFQFYNKNWNLRITDLHQGIVWGINTYETRLSPHLMNRFDYDGIYGTVLNRFLSQAANGHPLTVYGSGGQTRAFINIADTARCIKLAVGNNRDAQRVTIFNQVSETRSVLELAQIVSSLYSVPIEFVANPRKELATNDLEVENKGLRSLGFEPILLNQGLMADVAALAEHQKNVFDPQKVLNSPKW
jgi:UDP-sulfoquinovose synthase